MANQEESSKSEGARWLVACLGNPGKEYAKTRHNLGFMVGEALADSLSLSFSRERKARAAKLTFARQTVHLILPETYMNLSGQAVLGWMSYLKIPVSKLLVVYDDIDLPFTELKLKLQGSSGGHNGLKSIEQVLGSSYYARLKMGIGLSALSNVQGKVRPKGDQLASYVLSPFSEEERPHLPLFIEKGKEAVLQVLKIGLQQAMCEINRKESLIGQPASTLTVRNPPLRGEEK